MELDPVRPQCGHMIGLKVYRDAAALAEAAAALIEEYIRPSDRWPAHRAIMLAGGSTPMAAYARIAASPCPVEAGLQVLFSDDRHVRADSPKSNYGNTRPLLNALGLAAPRVLRVQGELPLAIAADRYDADLRALQANGCGVALGLLGLGADGHTASLFHRSHLEQARGRLALGVDRPDGMQGVSVTPDFLAGIGRIVFLVAGPDKRIMLQRLLHEPTSLIAGLAVRGNPHVEVWADALAHGKSAAP